MSKPESNPRTKTPSVHAEPAAVANLAFPRLEPVSEGPDNAGQPASACGPVVELRVSNSASYRVRSDMPFLVGLCILSSVYLLLIVGMLLADLSFTTVGNFFAALRSEEIRYAIRLSLISCSMTALLSLWIAVPIGYLMSRYRFRGKAFVDAVLDIPIVLPPLVIGLSLLILFRTPAGRFIERFVPMTYAVPGIILAQWMVACAFAVRTMRTTFDQISPRQEQVALTLGCSQSQAFWQIVLPQARRGILAAGTLAWARALGEFGPILIFSGATRMRTEVMPTSVFLELSVGNIEAAVAVSLLMVIAAVAVLLLVRVLGQTGAV
jgi:molybdate transport system permease protein